MQNKISHRNRLWVKLAQLESTDQINATGWKELKRIAKELAEFNADDMNNDSAAKKLLSIVYGLNEWHQLKSELHPYVDAYKLVKDVEAELKTKKLTFNGFIEANSNGKTKYGVRRLSDNHRFTGATLKREYYKSLELLNIKRINLEKLFKALAAYNFEIRKDDLDYSESQLQRLITCGGLLGM